MGEFLFDMEPFTKNRKGRPFHRRNEQTPIEVRRALAHLKKTLDAIPREEMREREQRWRALQAISHSLSS